MKKAFLYFFSLLVLCGGAIGCSHNALAISAPEAVKERFAVQIVEVDGRKIIEGIDAISTVWKNDTYSEEFEVNGAKITGLQDNLRIFSNSQQVKKEDLLPGAYMKYEYPLILVAPYKKSTVDFEVIYPTFQKDNYTSYRPSSVLSNRRIEVSVKDATEDSATLHISYIFPTLDIRTLYDMCLFNKKLKPYTIDKEITMKYNQFYHLDGFETALCTGLKIEGEKQYVEKIDMQYKIFYIKLIPPRK